MSIHFAVSYATLVACLLTVLAWVWAWRNGQDVQRGGMFPDVFTPLYSAAVGFIVTLTVWLLRACAPARRSGSPSDR